MVLLAVFLRSTIVNFVNYNIDDELSMKYDTRAHDMRMVQLYIKTKNSLRIIIYSKDVYAYILTCAYGHI